MVAIDRDNLMSEGEGDIMDAFARYLYVAKLGLESKTQKELKGN